MSWPTPLTLRTAGAVLVPLDKSHHDALVAAAHDGELWKLWYTSIPPPEGMAKEIGRRLDLQAKGAMVPFTVIDPATGRPVGMTTYMNIDAANKRLEIGGTWYAKSAHRTALNTHCKLLLLGHAFDTLECVAVEFRTHFFNQQSRRAIERLGAKLDGILRNHVVMPDGSLRDTCVYSILPSEWPAVKTHLEYQISRHTSV